MPDLDDLLAVLHVVGGVVWAGAWVAICAFAADVVRHPSKGRITRHFTVMAKLGAGVIGPSSLLVLVAGIPLVLRADWVVMSDLWIVVGLAGYVVATLLGVLGLGRTAKRVKLILAEGDLPAAVAATRLWYRVALVITIALLLITIDMVIKP